MLSRVMLTRRRDTRSPNFRTVRRYPGRRLSGDGTVLPPVSAVRLVGEQRELLDKAPYAGMIPSARKAAIMGDYRHQSPETPHGSRIDPYVGQYAERARGMVASEIRALFAVTARPEIVSLAGGSPYVTALPLDAVGDMFGQLVADRGSAALQYCTAQGDAGLREKICEVMSLEGIRAHPDDVVVTVGSQQALDLITRIFIDPGDVVLAEAPSYVGALGAFAAYQADVVHVPMDDQGLIPEALGEAIAAAGAAGRRVKFLYTVPNFQNPAGVTLAAGRRHAILDICQA